MKYSTNQYWLFVFSLCYQLLKIMDKYEIKKKIDRNRELIEKALEMNDTGMMYYIVRRLAKDNEKLMAKLK